MLFALDPSDKYIDHLSKLLEVGVSCTMITVPLLSILDSLSLLATRRTAKLKDYIEILLLFQTYVLHSKI